MATKNANPGSAGFVEAEDKTYVAITELKPGAVGIAGAVMQNVTHIAPAPLPAVPTKVWVKKKAAIAGAICVTFCMTAPAMPTAPGLSSVMAT